MVESRFENQDELIIEIMYSAQSSGGEECLYCGCTKNTNIYVLRDGEVIYFKGEKWVVCQGCFDFAVDDLLFDENMVKKLQLKL